MSEDTSRLNELQSALRQKMADNKSIADSFKIENGTVVVSTEQKSAFDKNMRDIKEIKGLIEGLEGLREVDTWNNGGANSVAAAAAAGGALPRTSFKSVKCSEIMALKHKSLSSGL